VGEHGDDLVELGFFQTAVWVSAAEEINRASSSHSGSRFATICCASTSSGLSGMSTAVELAVLHRAHIARFDQVVARERENAALRQAAHRVAERPYTLKQRGDAMRRGD